MNSGGRYADARTFSLPDGWQPVGDEVLQVAKTQALSALALESSLSALKSYYDRTGSYAGTLFMDAQPNDPLAIEASDLYAVTTLSMNLDARHGRLLLDGGAATGTTRQRLSAVASNLSLTRLGDGAQTSAETLSEMYALHSWFRDLLGNNSNRWVTAAKLCARKRPRLFPVRDNLVCSFLANGRALKTGNGWPGNFSVDIQVYAYLLTDDDVIGCLRKAQDEAARQGVQMDDEDLRVLDSVLWMKAQRLRS